MQDLTGLSEMRAWTRAQRVRGKRIAFVPTMGALHEGHLRLVDRARESADLVVMSIFVNPLQFGPQEDFSKYPRDLQRDRMLAAERGVDCLFAPDRAVMYPAEPRIRMDPGPMAERFEGAVRPGHFAGVLTVVGKLFHLVEPDVAVFGRKDFQQAMLIRRMARDLDFPLDIVIAPTVRELDGLALSSRNAYLSADQRRMALGLSRTLRTVEQLWRAGDADPVSVRTQGLLVLSAAGVAPDYLALVDEELKDVERVTASAIAVVAGKVGTTRLLDNVVLGEGVSGDPSIRK
ncbi:MAG TPA: pantoate--beta-alanine ligase [Gemmatimonadales bacterium]|nr:pantoate--beta-alanine ligase [Gemmatimonadales bacterium]